MIKRKWFGAAGGPARQPALDSSLSTAAAKTQLANEAQRAPRLVSGDISAPGHYIFTDDISGGMRIEASDVTVDMLGHVIRGAAGPNVATVGLMVASGLKNVTIRGGGIYGHHYGLQANDVAGLHVDRMVFEDQNFRGIGVAGRDISVTNTRFERIDGCSRYSDAYAMAIEINGPGAKVLNSVIRDFYPTDSGEGVGVLHGYGTDDSVVRRNLICNSRLPENGRTFAVWSSAMRTLLEDNFVCLTAYGVEGHGAAGNVLIDVPCESYLRNPADDLRALTGRPIACPDDYARAARRFDAKDRNSLFRMAQIHRIADEFLLAYAYYWLAARAGSGEAADAARNLVAGGYVNAAEEENAQRLADILYGFYVRRAEADAIQPPEEKMNDDR